MKKTEKFELLSDHSNAVVVRHVDRNFPGLLIQGDTLMGFFSDMQELKDEAEAGNMDSVLEISNIFLERFTQLLTHYENILEGKGYDLPYKNSVNKS